MATTKIKPKKKPQEGLFAAFKRLDNLLEGAVAIAQAAYGPNANADRFRGLYISYEEIQSLFAREPGFPLLWAPIEDADKSAQGHDDITARLDWLQRVFGLSTFDMDVMLITLAPEIDLRYERIYAYLHDDVTKKQPTVDLALNLLCSTPDDKLTRRWNFGADAPLVRHGLIHVFADPSYSHVPLLAQALKLDQQIVNFVLGHEMVDARLAPCCQLIHPSCTFDSLALTSEVKQALIKVAGQVGKKRLPIKLYFQGAPGTEKQQAAEAMASEIGTSVLMADLSRALDTKTDFEETARLLFREAWFQNAVLVLDGLDVLRTEAQVHRLRVVMEALKVDAGITIFTGSKPWVSLGHGQDDLWTVHFPLPEFAERHACWQAKLADQNIQLNAQEVETVASRFRLTPAQIAMAVTGAKNQVQWRTVVKVPQPSTSKRHGKVTLKDLFAAARAQCGHDLDVLTQKVNVKYTWANIVLPEDVITQLQEICQRVAHGHHVLGEWGFNEKLSLGKGITALFAGASGTGKTMAAEVIANQLELDLYKIDLSGVVSKYIGETEKNLDRIFRAAENANAILFFDEADALFGKRSEVRDSHDRYANIEISYLLQKMEEYEGIAILASNLRQNLDEAFVRRLSSIIHIPFPDEVSRQQIWKGIWPKETPMADEVDLDQVARHFKLSGGNIKNIALAAAFLAAEDGSSVRMSHIQQAIRREYQKMGKVLSEAELLGQGNGKPVRVGAGRELNGKVTVA